MNNLIKFEVELNQNFFPAGMSQTVYGLIRIKPVEGKIKGRMPLDLKFLLDRSGSMSDRAVDKTLKGKNIVDTILNGLIKNKKAPTKLDLLKLAVREVVDKLEDNDRISIITFDDRAKEEITEEITSYSDKMKVKEKISKIVCGGGTNMSDAIKMALNISDNQSNKIKRVIIFTDGEVNVPSVKGEEKDCKALASRGAKKKLPFIIFGTGISYNDKFLMELADITGGRMEHISNPSSVVDIFNQEIGVLGDIAITNMEGSINADKNIKFIEISRTVPDMVQINLSTKDYAFIPLGDLDRARGQAILFQAEIPALNEGTHELANLQIAFDAPLLNLIGQKEEIKIELKCVNDQSLCEVNNKVLSTVKLAGATKLQTLAMDRADHGDTVKAATLMDTVCNIYQSLGQTEMAAEAKTLTNAIKTKGQMGGETKDIRRTLTTRARQSVGKAVSKE